MGHQTGRGGSAPKRIRYDKEKEAVSAAGGGGGEGGGGVTEENV